MAEDGLPGLAEERFSKFFENKQKQKQAALASKRTQEAQSHQAIDGRVSSSTDRHGFVQLNVRVPLDLKNQVIEERGARRARGLAGCDVADIVIEALREFFQNTARGGLG